MNVENYLNLDTWKVYTPCIRRIDMYAFSGLCCSSINQSINHLFSKNTIGTK